MIEFLRAWVFLLLPAPWLAWRFLPLLPARAALSVPAGVRALLLRLSQSGYDRRLRWPGALWLRWLGWIALLVALAGPQTLGKELLQPTGRDLIVALDLSASMAERDMIRDGQPAERYAIVRDLVGGFINGRKGDRVALIAFAQEAYLIAPLTFDTGAVSGLLDELQIGLPGRKTDLGQAIALTIRTLQDHPPADHVLVLLSDGESNTGPLAPSDAAILAAERGIRIYTIGFASDADAGGTSLLKEVAELTTGRFFTARSEGALAAIYAELDRIESTAIDQDPARLHRDWSAVALLAAILALAGVTFTEWRE